MAQTNVAENVVAGKTATPAPITAQLVPVTASLIGEATVPTVNARELHGFLKVGRDFSTWIKERIEEYEFLEGQDFTTFSPKRGKTPKGGRPTIEYHLSMDMAKELSMVERTPQGQAARRYFIECERRLFTQAKPDPATLPLSTKEDRLPLRQIITEWAARLASPDVPNKSHHRSVYKQLNANFGIASVTEMPAAWIPDAVAWVQAKIDGPRALPSKEAEPIKELPAAKPTLSEGYPDLKDHNYWAALQTDFYLATRAFETELKRVKEAAFRPFTGGRKGNVASSFDMAMTPTEDMFKVAESELTQLYRLCYHSLEGCKWAAHFLTSCSK